MTTVPPASAAISASSAATQASPAAPRTIRAAGLALRHWPGWLAGVGIDTGALAAELVRSLAWQQPRVRVHGRVHAVPRLTCWMADPGCRYRYSGLLHEPDPWLPGLDALRHRLTDLLGCRFNSLLLNRYRSGDDRMGWHADDEPELEPDHPIASLSLGTGRDLRFRPRPGDSAAGAAAPFALTLADGDLLVMDGPTQRHWQHALPSRRRVTAERINLTFRRIRTG